MIAHLALNNNLSLIMHTIQQLVEITHQNPIVTYVHLTTSLFFKEIVVVVIIQLHMQSVPITTKVSLNPTHGEVYTIQQYIIKFVSAAGWCFSPVSTTNNPDPIPLFLTLIISMPFRNTESNPFSKK